MFLYMLLIHLLKCNNQIVVLENGKVVENGPHEILLSKAGRYAQLWGQQNNTMDAFDTTITLKS